MTLHVDDVFAPLDHDHVLERLAGGNETEVYWTDDRRYVVKLKYDLGGSLNQALQWARQMRAVADRYTACLGERHTIPNCFIVARGSDERRRMKALDRLPQRLWSFLVERTVLRSHNLMRVHNSEPRIVLIDYDPVRRGRFSRLIYFAVRRVLLLRDLAALARLRLSAGIDRKGKLPTLRASAPSPNPS